MYAITTEDGRRLFSEHDIKEQAGIYYQKLYTPRASPAHNHSWTNRRKNKEHEKEFYNREITMKEV